MLGRIVRGVALGALTVVPFAPIAVAGAAADPGSTTTSTTSTGSPPRSPNGPTDPQATWDAAAGGAAHAATAAPSARAGIQAAAAATISVSPATALVSGQSVSVAGTGLGSDNVAVLQCESGVGRGYECDLRNLGFQTPDVSGALTVDLTVHRTISGPSGRIDCATAPGTCEIVIASSSAAEVLARQTIAFDPNAPFPSPSIVAVPAVGLLTNQVVTVTGAGFAANDQLYVRECATVDRDCYGSSIPVTSDGAGAFSTAYTVSLRVGDGLGSATHCLAVDCILRADSATDLDYQADAPIAFDPNQPLPPTPAIEVTPSTGLVHDQQVTITGTGFDANGYVEIDECSSVDSTYCNEYLTDVQTDAAGAFSATANVSRIVSVSSSGPGSWGDCAALSCSITAASYSESLRLAASVPISFDGSVPPPAPPTLEVTPNSNLPYRAQLAIHGTGFLAGEYVYASFCQTSGLGGGCGFYYADGQADSNGVVDLVLGVKRRVAFDGNRSTVIDCIDPGTQCSVSLQGQRQFERAEVPVTFDPNAPIPPPPALSVTPDHGLGWKQVVGFGGSGFTPGPQIVQECGDVVISPDFSYLACTGYTQIEANADGMILGTIEVRRIIDAGFDGGGPTVDCATSETPCTVRVGYGDPDETASVDLGFDPNSQPPPPPVLHLVPGKHLRDGQTIGVWGSGYTPGALVGLAPCVNGATAIADTCDLGHAFTAQANGNGDFLATYNVQGVIGTSQGATDCTVAAATCSLASANVNDLSEFGSSPFSVDPVELELHSTSVVEGTGGVTEAHVMVELSDPIGHPTMVEWRAHPGTASEADYLSRSGRIMIPAGATEGMIHARVVGDAINESTERFTIEAIEALGTRITDATASVKIRDDDAEPVVTTRDITFVEGDHGTKIGVVPVWLSAPSGREVVVSYRTHHGSARSDSDFVRTRGEVVLEPGQTGVYIFFDIVNDRVHERTESFTMELRDADHAELRDHVSTVTIQDND